MKRPAVFFDRDNTLIVSDGYLGDPTRVVLMEGAPDAVAKARQYGFKVVTVSNQSGVARGMFTEDDVVAVNRRMDELLQQANPSAVIEDHEYCPYHPEAPVEQYRQDSDLRKPKPGMILAAANKLSLDLSRSWVIGDAPRDIKAGKAAGCRTILFNPPGISASPAASEISEEQPDFTAASLREAIEIVARESLRPLAAKARSESAAKVELPTKAEPAVVAAAPSSQETDPSPQNAAPQLASRMNAAAHAAVVSTVVSSPQTEPIAARQHSASAPPQSPAQQPSMVKVEGLLEQILFELKRRQHEAHAEFSISKLMAGIVQILALGAMFLAYLEKSNPGTLHSIMLFAIALQTLTIALLIMGRQR